MAHWKHKTQRSGFMGLGTRKNAAIRADGIFEAPDGGVIEKRLLAAGHEKLDAAPGPCKVVIPKPLSAKDARLKARVDRRKVEARDAAKAAKVPAAARRPATVEVPAG